MEVYDYCGLNLQQHAVHPTVNIAEQNIVFCSKICYFLRTDVYFSKYRKKSYINQKVNVLLMPLYYYHLVINTENTEHDLGLFCLQNKKINKNKMYLDLALKYQVNLFHNGMI